MPDSQGLGLGPAVRVQPGLDAVPGNPCGLIWHGANGRGFFCEPKEQPVVSFGTDAPCELRRHQREPEQILNCGEPSR